MIPREQISQEDFVEIAKGLEEQGLLEIKPGKIIMITKKGLKYSQQVAKEKKELFVFLFLYWNMIQNKNERRK